jgi:hypothetical protein
MFLRKSCKKYLGNRECAEEKCYKVIVKSRGENVILETVETLENEGFEFPRTH